MEPSLLVYLAPFELGQLRDPVVVAAAALLVLGRAEAEVEEALALERSSVAVMLDPVVAMLDPEVEMLGAVVPGVSILKVMLGVVLEVLLALSADTVSDAEAASFEVEYAVGRALPCPFAGASSEGSEVEVGMAGAASSAADEDLPRSPTPTHVQ